MIVRSYTTFAGVSSREPRNSRERNEAKLGRKQRRHGVRREPVDVCEAGEKPHPGNGSRDGAASLEILLDGAGWATRREKTPLKAAARA